MVKKKVKERWAKLSQAALSKKQSLETSFPVTNEIGSNVSDSDLDSSVAPPVSDWDEWSELSENSEAEEDDMLKDAFEILRADVLLPRRRAVYTGSSRANVYKKAKKNREASAHTKAITEYFGTAPRQQPERKIQAPISIVLEEERARVEKALEKIAEVTSAVGISTDGNVWDALRLRAVERYLELVLEGTAQVEASKQVAHFFFKGGAYKATCVRDWARAFLESGELPGYKQGQHQKTKSVIDDEDVQDTAQKWLRSQKDGTVEPAMFASYLKETLLPSLAGKPAVRASVSESTAKRWLHKLGWHPDEHRQGVYYDGHDREDVVEYNLQFVRRMFERAERMETYSGDDSEVVAQPTLAPGQKKAVLITHDECCFHAHDGPKKTWKHKSRSSIRKKGKGKPLMVSDFLCACHGRLVHTENGVKTEARVITFPGKNADGYWTGEHVVKQVKDKATPVAELLHPGCELVFCFDNSSNHGAFSADALRAQNINLSPTPFPPPKRKKKDAAGEEADEEHSEEEHSEEEYSEEEHAESSDGDEAAAGGRGRGSGAGGRGGGLRGGVGGRSGALSSRDRRSRAGSHGDSEHAGASAGGAGGGKPARAAAAPAPQAVRMRDGWYHTAAGERVVQPLYFPADHGDKALRGHSKGVKQLLTERGLWPTGKFNLQCKACKGKYANDPNRFTRTNCCARRLLASQPDFASQKCALQEVIEAAGHTADFYAKYHCETNFIERYWGYAKRLVRKRCNYTFAGLQREVPIALDSCPLSVIRNFSRKAWRYMDAYRKGLTGRLAEFAVKKYKSHRRIPNFVLSELEKLAADELEE
jgi:hypothetical protein